MTAWFKIIKNAPIPKANSKRAIYPFASMEVGDAFDAPGTGGKIRSATQRQSSIHASARTYAKRNNPTAKFTARVIDDNTVRCWRIA